MIAVPAIVHRRPCPQGWTGAGGSFGRGARPMAWRIRLREDPLFWANAAPARPPARALHALHAFCSEIETIAHSEASSR